MSSVVLGYVGEESIKRMEMKGVHDDRHLSRHKPLTRSPSKVTRAVPL